MFSFKYIEAFLLKIFSFGKIFPVFQRSMRLETFFKVGMGLLILLEY